MLLSSLILAHLIADFCLQTEEMVRDKKKYISKHMLHHLILTAMSLTLIQFEYNFTKITTSFLFPLILICVTHFLIDWSKMNWIDKINLSNNEQLKKLGFFLLDQLLHLGVLILSCVLFFDMNIDIFAISIQHMIEESYGIANLSMIELIITVWIIIILATSVSGHIIKIILGSLPSHLATFEGKFAFKNEMKELEGKDLTYKDNHFTAEYHYITYSNELLSRGKLIGYIERLLVILLTLVGAYPAVAFIVAAKAIARFKQLDDRNWAEYFLLGTLSSMFLGTVLGFLLKLILH